MTFRNLVKILGLDKVDWKKATTRLLAVLWGALIFSWICKIFLGQTFEIITHNTNFINICNFIENNKLLSVIYPFPFYLLSAYLVIWIISREKPNKNQIWFILLFTFIYRLKMCNEIVGMIFEFLFIYIGYSIVKTKKIWRGLETYLVVFCLELISLFIKNIGYVLDDENILISTIYMFDYYIMMSIYCVNVIIRKEGIIMGLFGTILLSKKGKQLIAYREKLISKRTKLDSRIREVDRAIENEKNK